jgi:transposase
MSEAQQPTTEPQESLFEAGELPPASAPAKPLAQVPAAQAMPRLLQARRDQVELRSFDLEASLAHDHPARAVWAFVQALDLKPLYAQIRSVQGRAGAPAIDPAILMALWLWATVDAVGSAREVARLCERDDAYRWLCGGVGVNHHTLSDFRTSHTQWLDEQLSRSIAALMQRKLVKLEVVAQDGLRVRAAAKAASFRRLSKLQQLQQQAREQVQALKAELDADSSASTRRKQAARERAAREREQRLSQALQTLQELEQRAGERTANKAGRRKALGHSARKRNDDPPAPPAGPVCSEPSSSAQDGADDGINTTPATKTVKAVRQREPRASTTDPQAQVMRMADGGFRPAYNVQLAVDEATQLIAAVQVINEGSDMHSMQPMHASLEQRYGRTPTYWLADGGYLKHEAIEQLSLRGTRPVVPPARSRNPEFDPLAPQASDTAPVAAWRGFMATSEGQALYKRRAASVECANAQLRRRGLQRLNVRGLLKARAVALWHALAHNLMRMRSLGFAPA